MGKEVWKEGIEYDGEFSKGMKQGKGRYVFSSGDIYIGEFK